MHSKRDPLPESIANFIGPHGGTMASSNAASYYFFQMHAAVAAVFLPFTPVVTDPVRLEGPDRVLPKVFQGQVVVR